MNSFKDEYLDEEFIASFNSGNKSFLTEIGRNVFFGKILSNTFCNLILEKIKSYELHEGQKLAQNANSMHNNAILLDDLGLNELVNEFYIKYLIKIIHSIFPARMNQEFDSIHSYVVRYGHVVDKHLDFHVDDSLVTMNLCLNEEFSGSDLIFNGIRCPIHIDTLCEDSEKVIVNHKKGFTVLHDGKNRHYVTSIQSGSRYGLIIWCQNSKERSGWFDALKNYECVEFCDYQSKALN
jgi:hypothetical protein